MKATFYLLLGLVVLTACSLAPGIEGSNVLKDASYEFEDFNSINVSGPYTVNVVQSDEYKVRIQCDDNLLEFVKVEKKGDELKLSLEKGKNYNFSQLSAEIHLPTLKEFKGTGASVTELNSMDGNELDISLTGASRFHGKVDISDDLEIALTGASGVTLEGEAEKVDLNLTGASNIKGKDLVVSSELHTTATGASNITITCNGEISASLTGASNFYYYGDGQLVESKSTGASNIVKRN